MPEPARTTAPAVETIPDPEPRRTSRPSGTTEVFFRRDGEHRDPVVVVHHIQKTAGTSLRKIVRANLPPCDVELAPSLRSLRYAPEELVRWYRDWHASLDDDRRARLCCVMSHWGGYVLPALERPADALVLVREPVDRTLSYFYFRRGDRDLSKLEQIYATRSRERPKFAHYSNWQSRALLSIFYDVSELPYSAGPCAGADEWRARLRDLVERVFVVGVQDRFEEYVGQLARRYGWSVFVPRSKVNAARPAVTRVTAELVEAIRAYNWLDGELYELSRQVQQRREHSDDYVA